MVTFFRIAGGHLSDPIAFPLKIPQESGKPLSMEARVRETLAAAPAPAKASALEIMEHLALLKRWYFRSNKTGEVFFADHEGVLPLRRIVRGIARVFRGEQPAPDLSESARDYWVNRGKEAERKQESSS